MFPNISEIEGKVKRLGFDSLSPDERIVFVIADGEFEINLGGVWGYLHNSSGNNLTELVIALGKIGANETSQAGQRLLNALSDYRCAKNQEERVLALQTQEAVRSRQGRRSRDSMIFS